MLTDPKLARPTGMAMALFEAATKNPRSRTTRRIERSIARNAGLIVEREVDLKVSYRTAQNLKKEGVL